MIGVAAPIPKTALSPSPPSPAEDAHPSKSSLTEITQPFDLEEKEPIAPPAPGGLSAPPAPFAAPVSTPEPPPVEAAALREIGERDTPVIDSAPELSYLAVDVEPPSIDVDTGEDLEIEAALGALDDAVAEAPSPIEEAADVEISEDAPAPLAASPASDEPNPALISSPDAPAPIAPSPQIAPEASMHPALAHDPRASARDALDEAGADRLSAPPVSSADRGFLMKVFIGGAALLAIIAVALIILFRGADEEPSEEVLAAAEPPPVETRVDEAARVNAQPEAAQPEALAATETNQDAQEEQGAQEEAPQEEAAKEEEASAAPQDEVKEDAQEAPKQAARAVSGAVLIAPPTEVDDRYEALTDRRRRAKARELVNAGNFLRNRDQHDEAIERYVDALSHDPRIAAAISGGLQSWLEKGEAATALAWSERLIEALPSSAGSYTLKARALLLLDRVDEAAQAVEAARELAPRNKSVAELDEEIAARGRSK